MAQTEYTDITSLREKRANLEQVERIEDKEIDPKETLTAEEFIQKIVEPIIELQEKTKELDGTVVKGINQNNRIFKPEEDGIVYLPSAETTVSIIYDGDESSPVVSIDGTMKVRLQVVSTQNSQATFEAVNVEIYTANIGSTQFTKRGEFAMQSVNAGSSAWEERDITKYINNGEQQVRFVATGVTTGVTGYLLLSNVTLSTFGLSFATNWNDAQTGSIKLAYYINGAIAKSLYVKVDGLMMINGKSIGTAVYNQTPYTEGLEITDARVCTHGTHRIEAWLAATEDSTKRTETLINEVFYFADPEDDRPYLVVNNIATNAQPYVNTHIFDYCVFKNGAASVPVIIRATSADGLETFLEHDLGNVATGSIYAYNNAFNVSSTEEDIPVYIYFYTKVGGRETLLREGYSLVNLDNTNNFAPTAMQSSGFILNPKNRSNNETDPRTIVNENTGELIESEWEGFDMVNDGYVGEVLRIPAKRNLKIKYDMFSQLRTPTSNYSMTFEVDFKVSNLQSFEAEADTILSVGEKMLADNKILGFNMMPLKAHLLTQNKRSINVQDVQWKEDERIRLAVNIVYNLANQGRNYVRIFVNSVINREFEYTSDVFSDGTNTDIVIGSDSADIDIYGIRIYKQALSSQQIQQDYKSALATSEEKVAYQKANDIMGDDNTISFTKSQQAGYNTLRWIADSNDKNLVVDYSNQGNNATKGTLEMIVRNADGTPNWRYCQYITHCKQKGQGTSSMTYWKWNITYTATEDSQRYYMNQDLEWVLDEEKTGVDCYFLFPNGHSTRKDIKAVKNVAKLNWASSMQSHKLGWCNLYTDLWWKCIGNTAINAVEGYENCRRSVTQLPFLFFAENASGVTYKNVMTFGPAKFDKLCWGTKAPSQHYKPNGKATSMFTCLEGSANGRPLPERKVPWIIDEVFYYLNRSNDNDPKNECFVYNDEENFDLDKGVMNVYEEGTDNEYEIPKGFTPVPGSAILWKETEDTEYDTYDIYKCEGGNTIKFFRRAYNFDYLHSHNLRVISGTADNLRARTDLDTNYQYWVTQANGSNEAYDLFRWNPITSTWVNAGAALDASQGDGYARLNIMEQCTPWMREYSISAGTSDPNKLNEAFIQARVQHYFNNSTQFYDEQGFDFDQAFRKFGALKDNWCKNTYETLMPNGLISPDSDDNDTSGDLDNVGASKCPYFAEEHDRCDAEGNFDQEGTNTYWNSDTNVRWCLREKARGEEIASMMQTMLNAMADDAGSVMAEMEKYFFDAVQRYLPATVYNENARLLYEDAAVALANGSYTNAIDPLSQNLGDHLQSELEFWNKRIAYLGSWSRYNGFANKAGTGTFSFRSGKQNAKYKFTVKAHQAVYPAIMVDGSVSNIKKHRMLPGETYTLDEVTVGTQDITCFLCGVDYFTSIGSLTGMAINSDVLNVVGKRLTEFQADGADNNFRPNGVTFAAPRMKTIEMTNVKTVSGVPNISGCINLETLNFKGDTSITGIMLPNSAPIQELKLPSNLGALEIENLESVKTFELEGVDYMRTIKVSQSADIIAHAVYELLAGI